MVSAANEKEEGRGGAAAAPIFDVWNVPRFNTWQDFEAESYLFIGSDRYSVSYAGDQSS